METLLQVIHNTFVTFLIILLVLFMIATFAGADSVRVNVNVETDSGSYVNPYRPLPQYEDRPVYVPYWQKNQYRESGDGYN